MRGWWGTSEGGRPKVGGGLSQDSAKQPPGAARSFSDKRTATSVLRTPFLYQQVQRTLGKQGAASTVCGPDGGGAGFREV